MPRCAAVVASVAVAVLLLSPGVAAGVGAAATPGTWPRADAGTAPPVVRTAAEIIAALREAAAAGSPAAETRVAPHWLELVIGAAAPAAIDGIDTAPAGRRRASVANATSPVAGVATGPALGAAEAARTMGTGITPASRPCYRRFLCFVSAIMWPVVFLVMLSAWLWAFCGGETVAAAAARRGVVAVDADTLEAKERYLAAVERRLRETEEARLAAEARADRAQRGADERSRQSVSPAAGDAESVRRSPRRPTNFTFGGIRFGDRGVGPGSPPRSPAGGLRGFSDAPASRGRAGRSGSTGSAGSESPLRRRLVASGLPTRSTDGYDYRTNAHAAPLEASPGQRPRSPAAYPAGYGAAGRGTGFADGAGGYGGRPLSPIADVAALQSRSGTPSRRAPPSFY